VGLGWSLQSSGNHPSVFLWLKVPVEMVETGKGNPKPNLEEAWMGVVGGGLDEIYLIPTFAKCVGGIYSPFLI